MIKNILLKQKGERFYLFYFPVTTCNGGTVSVSLALYAELKSDDEVELKSADELVCTPDSDTVEEFVSASEIVLWSAGEVDSCCSVELCGMVPLSADVDSDEGMSENDVVSWSAGELECKLDSVKCTGVDSFSAPETLDDSISAVEIVLKSAGELDSTVEFEFESR